MAKDNRFKPLPLCRHYWLTWLYIASSKHMYRSGVAGSAMYHLTQHDIFLTGDVSCLSSRRYRVGSSQAVAAQCCVPVESFWVVP